MAAVVTGRIDPAVIAQRMKDHAEAEKRVQERRMWKKYAPDKYLKAKIKDGKTSGSFNGIKARS